MATEFLWSAVGSKIALLTTELNSLAEDSYSAASGEIDNSSVKAQMGTLTLHLGSAAFAAGDYVNVYFVPADDHATSGTFPTGLQDGNSDNYFAGTINIYDTTAAQNETLPYVTIPPGYFKVYLRTSSGCPTLASSGNTLDLYPTPSQFLVPAINSIALGREL